MRLHSAKLGCGTGRHMALTDLLSPTCQFILRLVFYNHADLMQIFSLNANLHVHLIHTDSIPLPRHAEACAMYAVPHDNIALMPRTLDMSDMLARESVIPAGQQTEVSSNSPVTCVGQQTEVRDDFVCSTLLQQH